MRSLESNVQILTRLGEICRDIKCKDENALFTPWKKMSFS